MAHTRDDTALLHAAAGGDDEAVNELVRRHLDFVYACARRQLGGNAHLAQDVAQAVFMILRKKAATVANGRSLTGWLYTTTRYAALAARKMEARRTRHEQKAAAMRPEVHLPDPTPDDIAPVLDGALAKLREADRHAILLRYFRGMSMAQVASATGTTEEATRKRLSRAIERLRGVLASSGSVLSAGALTAAMETLARDSAPPAIFAAIATATTTAHATSAITGGTIAKGAMTMMVWTKVKLAAAVVGCVALAGAGTTALTHALAAPPTEAQTQNHQAAPPVKPAPAPVAAAAAPAALAQDADAFPQFINCRIRRPVKLTLTPDAPTWGQITIGEFDLLDIAFDIDPQLSENVGFVYIGVMPTDGQDERPTEQALRDMNDPAKLAWAVVGLSPDQSSVLYGDQEPSLIEAGWTQGGASLNHGSYWLVITACDKNMPINGSRKPIASAGMRITVEKMPSTQIMIADHQPDGSIKYDLIQQSRNHSNQTVSENRFMNSNFVTIDGMGDGTGEPVAYVEDRKGGHTDYTVTLNEPVPPGEPFFFSMTGAMQGLIRTTDGQAVYEMNHSPGSNETRRIEIHRLPKDAQVHEVIPKNAKSRLIDGRPEYLVDDVVPPNGSIHVLLRYSLPET